MIPTIEWHNNKIRMIDQRKIPTKIQWYVCRGYKDVISAIRKMVIRGAPAIGVAAAMGLALGAESIKASKYDTFRKRLGEMANELLAARPTAVNLKWATERLIMLADAHNDLSVDEIKQHLKKESQRILDEDIQTNKKIGVNGQALIPDSAIILTHCNAGSLATAGYGTAIGVIRAAVENGKKVKVIADETRPWLQGLRLTSFELMQEHIPVTVIVDNAAGYLMRQGKINLVITGADRIAANGDVANKIGTYQVAVLANENSIPFYVAAPFSTIDVALKNGDMIPVETRNPEEITRPFNREIGPENVPALNPAFDITPSKYISGIITERGILSPPYMESIMSLTSL